ncbi:hypothetical protein SCHPADRAFT_934853 [Schizopora paradoxa]|uniref:DH domain-containing protein n=1 Tax=Schizopora paradoxa TaxID=27342 RepID=A0A0H2SSZ8_9AGAM|nr:hypothetical protein SCHPADRAFT_934853 [Schizopora paradoxa]
MSTPMLNGAGVASTFSKALPLASKDDDLPRPPLSSSTRDDLPLPPPPPPPKINCDIPEGGDLSPDQTLSAARSVPPSPFREALGIPEISSPPESPSFASSSHSPSPQSLSAVDARPKKANPFVDLLETEKTYVDTLSGIIRKVASAWSRSNLPPSQLDSMFRSIEAIFKANRFLLAKLKEIGLNPSSPRAIGDLLMKWIDHLDVPYTNYCQQYLSGFDTWESVQSNPRLPSVLETFSSTNPPTSGSPTWTLDALFALPRSRIKYYQKLYNRLLKNSAKGKSTDQMLVSAVEKLDRLMNIIDERNGMSLPNNSGQPVVEMVDEVVIDTRNVSVPVPEHSTVGLDGPDARLSVGSSARDSSSSGQRSSRETAPTSEGGSPILPSMTVLDIERRLSTNRCMDLFTMKPRNVRLSISTANLPYTREMRLSEDGFIQFTPKSTAQEVIHQRGHIFLLTDLFLVCEWVTPSERISLESEQMDMWLCYPPLAAKHLRVGAIDVDALEITILKKEVLIVRFGSSSRRDFILREFQAVIDAASSLPPPSKQPPPPVPPIPGLSRSSSAQASSEGPPLSLNTAPTPEYQPRSGSGSPRAMSPASAHSSAPRRTFSIEGDNARSNPPSRSMSVVDHGPEPPPYSPERLQSPGLPGDPTASRNAPSSFGPGQVMPPHRSDSSRSAPGAHDGPRPGMAPTSEQIIPPPRGQSAMSPPPQLGMNGMGPPGGQFPPRGNSMPQQPPMGRGPMGPMGPGMQFMGGPPPPGGRPLNGPPMQMQQPPYPPMGPPGPNGPPPMHQQQFDPSPNGMIHKSPSTRSLSSQRGAPNPQGVPPLPHMNPGYPHDQQAFQNPGHLRPMLSSNAFRPGIVSVAPTFVDSEPSPPDSPVEDQPPSGPAESAVTATVKCKVFLKQQHAQWKSLGSAKLTLYEQTARKDKQIVVQQENKDKTMLISTMVLTDGVERVGKTGVAIEISDKGARTGIVYMLQLRNEKAAGNLFDLLIAGSDRGFAH